MGADDLSFMSRGVPLMKRALYDPNLQTFACLDGSRVIPVRHVNDDYCDCRDGSDEPGTSACPQGSFYCPNAQYKPSVIPSSRVNDGICDCCDGSDEWRGVVLCSNICADLGKVLREEAAKELEMKRAGWTKRLDYSTTGRKENEDRKLKLEELKQKKDSLQKERDDAEEAKNDIEAREKEAKDKHEAAWEQMKSEKREELRRLAAENAFKDLDTSEDGLLAVAELLGRHDLDADGNGELSAEEAASLVGDSGVDVVKFVAEVWPKIESKYRPPASIQIDKAAEENAGATAAAAAAGEKTEEASTIPPEQTEPAVEVGEDAPQPSVEAFVGEEDPHPNIPDDHLAEGVEDAFGGPIEDDEEDDESKDDFHDEEDDDYDEDAHPRDDASSPPPVDAPPTEFASKDEELGLVKPDFDEDAKAKIAAADEARAAFQTVDDEFRNLEREIHDLEKTVGLDLGRAFEFAPLHGQCLEYTDREYIYKLCMYDRASQRPKHGGGETSLGTFTGWENDYLLMKYEHGQGCWNGPNRSAKVVLSCGVEDKLTSVSEPSRCEYDFRITTPAVCDKPEEEGGDEEEATKTGPPDSLGRDEL